MTLPPKPQAAPARALFSSGPCAKRPGWSAAAVGARAELGRSHRAGAAKAQLLEAIEKTRTLLEIPADHRIGIVPASDTGAYEMAMWSLLGARPVDALAWESFGAGWVTDAVKQLKLADCRVMTADYGALPDLSAVRPGADVLFTWNGTTSGARVPNADWIAADRAGLTLCDATSAAFAQCLDWPKIDVATFSWQKVMGGEAAHGVLVLSPRAVERLESFTPPWPLPKIFRLTKGGKLIEGVFKGETINTPSMLCVADYLDALDWGIGLGGGAALRARADANFSALQGWVDATAWVENLVAEPACRSNTSVCLRIVDPAVSALDDAGQRAFVKRMTTTLEKEGAAFDIAGYRDAPPGLRVWCGATVEAADVAALTPWLDWAFADARAALAAA
ncbi:phosphoserine transaminase [Rubrimonas cliftonensis]|uniref:phosphoserine transaminase n=1 Tax=Rubrimonas cliftonensis TaxID=89524 RepID=A0A1H4DU04_9RHOB|nr:phosphoserine transaminase [Rubrimonas cliftonensis]SEA76253.1 phosphoserine aminotransferase apoenzyme [Rubrimonas cliftonensis]